MNSRTAVIVGGGVIGLSTAFHLRRRGYGRVVVLEKDIVGDGSSRRAAGITSGLLWTETGIAARTVSLRLFKELERELVDYRYHDEHGCLALLGPDEWRHRQTLLPLYDRLRVPYRILSPDEIRARWPEIQPRDDMVGLHDPRGGYSEPDAYVSCLARKAAELGVEIREHQLAVQPRLEDGVIVGVETPSGVIRADAVVSSVHSWTSSLLTPLGVRLPVKNFVHQRYVSAPGASQWNCPPVNAEPLGGYVRPFEGNRLLLGVETSDREEYEVRSSGFHMSELRAPTDLLTQTAAQFAPVFPAIGRARWESERVGLIAFSLDGEPLLGPVAALPGLYIGMAFHSGGFSYSPVAGLLLAEFVSGVPTSVDVSTFAPDRFSPTAVDDHLGSRIPQRNAVRRRH